MRRSGLALALTAVGPALGQAPPTTRVLDCTSGGCHADQLKHKFLHGPTAVQACDMCHEYKDPARHTFDLKRQGKDLCVFCHLDKAVAQGPVVHDPVAKGDCTACHDPHGAQTRQMLKKDPMPALCADCHKDVLKGAHVHGPASSDCTACHKAHDSSHARLLTLEPRPLCISCHAEVGKTASGSAHPHKPAEGDCLQCHTPHASDQIKILKSAPADLCISCHQDVGKTAAAASHQHSAVSDVRACLNCHSAHGSEHAKQLAQDTVSTCLECHKQPIQVDRDRVIRAVAELADPKLHKHGPIAKDDCSGCHGVHGADQGSLLHKPYPAGFYQPFSDEAYALCFKCHDRNLAVAPTAEKETGFRDGARNLHWLHIAKSPQGRSCRACHTVHASRFEAQIADAVVFGQWKMPINFTPSEQGGSCSPGCHATERYNRLSAVKPAPIAAPATQPKK